MSEDKNTKSVDSNDLWLKIINEGVEDRVEVNQRMLIDKMLARYSSDFVVLRELIQNSDDAQSSSFTLEITCDPSTSTETYENVNKDDSFISQIQSNKIFEGLGQFIKNSLGTNSTSEPTDNLTSIENELNNCIIKEIRTINNGNIFVEDDWKRVITIAEGNTNVDAIGQFGVGFFSVFSYSEKPIIQSGKHCLAFVWQNGKSLTTFRKELSQEEHSSSTSVILNMKNKYILQTKTPKQIPETTKHHRNRRSKSKKNVTTNEIVPIIDLTQLKGYFTKVLSFTKYIQELIIQINGLIVFQVNKSQTNLSSNKITLASKRMNLNAEHNLLRFNSFTQTEQIFTIKDGPSITLNHIDVQASVVIDKDFHKQIQGVLKKSLPNLIHIQFLFPSNNIFEEEQWKILTNNNLNHQLLKELIPLKFDDGQTLPSGQIFIGLATHQSTGVGMHVFTHLVPTIERENIDLQDPYISIWNEQLLVSVGKIIRFIYDQSILDAVNDISKQSNQQLNAILSPFAFQTSAPNKDIGRMVVDGFFSSNKDLLVPVKRSPSDTHLSLIPSTEAFLTKSKYIQTFLPQPLVPFEVGKNDFFKTLKSRHWIEEMDNETIAIKIHESILLFDEFIGLLRWLCTNDINNKSYIKEILSKIRYRQTRQSTIIKLEKIEYFDTLNISSLPLPFNVLPSNIVDHISREDLQRRLSLSPITVKYLIEYYLLESQHYLFQNENTSKILLSFISQRWNQFNNTESDKIKEILSNMKCIPTSQGMKSPNESYIRSSNLSPDLPIITVYTPQMSTDVKENEYPVSIEFLKSIGCRTIHIPTLNTQSDISSDNSQTLENFIQNLLKQRKNLSNNDIQALKHNQCITGTTLNSNSEIKHKYKPNELHFPSVANYLQWNELPIIDWVDIDPRSQEYSFLKELGVREVPDLHKLIARIDQEHQNRSKTKDDYKLPTALICFAENFQEHYSKSWKSFNIKIAFLPSLFPDMNQSNEVVLAKTDIVYKESGPLCPSLLPDVLRCFSQYFDIGLLGVKPRPQISMAFEILMEKRNQLLNVQSAPIYFSYFNRLDGLNKPFIQSISNRAFIPLSGSNSYVKPSEVFVRSKNEKSSDDNSDDEITRGLIDYIDYGSEANSFLQTIGVLSYPSAQNLAHLLIERQNNYFAKTKDNTDDLITAKLRFYTNCLKQLSVASNLSQQLNVEPLRSRLINKSWCLAYQIIEKPDGNKERIFKIAKPSEICLDDDHQSAIDLKPLCAPDEPELTKLYQTFGSKWLSETVQRTLVHRGKFFQTERSKILHERIHHRLDMLFVNNRGESLDNIDEKRIQLLRNKFFVYESEGIQCQLSFQNKTITLNSTECSSCALENEKNKVILYIQKDILTLDYIDIASELTRYVYKKALDTLVHSISDKLSSPLETLKRRGIPVDRLLKTQQQQPIKLALQLQQPKPEETIQKQPLQQQEQPQQLSQEQPQQQLSQQFSQQQQQQSRQKVNHKVEEYQENEQPLRGFFQSLKDLLVPTQYPSVLSSPADSHENKSSTVERDRIEHFGRYKSSDETDINRMIGTSRPYSQREFNQSEHSRNEINNSCEFIPASNMILYPNLLHGISLYIDRNVTTTNIMLDQGKQLAFLLSSLAKQVFYMPVQTMHLFRDVDSARIAFNSNGSLFFNLRYFEQVFADDLRPYLENPSSSSSSTPIVRTIVNFYFMVTCHELSHNIDSNHDLNFINRLERVSVRFMDAKDAFLSKFSFQ